MAFPATLDEQIIENKRNELSFRVMHESAIVHNEETGIDIEIPFSSYTNKYRDYLNQIIVAIYLDEADCAKYRFRPKLFSVDQYGVTDFWNDILILNGCTSIREFEPIKGRPLYFYDPNRLKKYLNEILILENRIR